MVLAAVLNGSFKFKNGTAKRVEILKVALRGLDATEYLIRKKISGAKCGIMNVHSKL